MKLTLHQLPHARYSVADRCYEVRINGARIGEVARDDIETGGERHLWHGWLDEFPGVDEAGFGGGWDEAVGDRHMTRAEAVDDVLDEFLHMAGRLGVAPPWGMCEVAT